jgi:S-layer homology domain
MRLLSLGLLTALAAVISTDALAQTVPDYGTAQLSYVQVAGAAFTSDYDAQSPGLSNIISGRVLRTSGVAFAYFTAPLSLPSGAIVKSFQMDACDDTGSSGYVQGSMVETDRLGTIVAIINPFVLSDGTGCKTFTVDTTGLNTTKHFYLIANISAAPGHTAGLAGMVVGYQLQVSPPPGSATFGDVPTSHPFFQFIEALAASGITGGCGGGNYCPDNPVTRGQMAVFLSKALGLQFP